MPGKLLQHHLAHGVARAKSFLTHAYHGTGKILQHADAYSSMFRRILAAAQPALQDLGVADPVNRGPCMPSAPMIRQSMPSSVPTKEPVSTMLGSRRLLAPKGLKVGKL